MKIISSGQASHKLSAVLMLLSGVLLASCGGGGSVGGGTAPDTTPPTVSATSPANNATNVATNAGITATFSENMSAASITTATFTLNGPSGAVSGEVSYTGTTATFNPTANLAFSTIYTATITIGAQDAAGNALAANHTWSFTTGTAPDNTAPTVSSASPANNATNVAVNADITATFSENMSAASITTATFTLNGPSGAVSGEVSYTGATATFNPAANLAFSTIYTATITTGAQDAAGNALAANHTWSFTTGTAPDNTAPTVSSTSPANNATNVALTADITATFSETMSAGSISTATFTLQGPGTTPVTGAVSYSGVTATFDPAANLIGATTYTATLTTGAQDAAGNALAANHTWSFNTVTAATHAFNEALSFTRVGASNAPTFPTPLQVVLSTPATVDTFVAITASGASVSIAGGGVTILTGQTSAQVLMTGLQQSSGETLTATLDGTAVISTVRVLGVAEQPVISSLTPAAPIIVAGETVVLTVALDIPSPTGGTAITVGVNPVNAGTVPATVTVQADQVSATFQYADASLVNSATVNATLGATTLSSTIQMLPQVNHLVINEVDYDNVGADTAEFIEIYNPTASPISLEGYAIMLVNGATAPGAVYSTISLSSAGILLPGGYLVVGSSSVVSGVMGAKIDLGAVSNIIQNGAPDGVALVHTPTNTVIDKLSYEGGITAATLPGLGTVDLVEGTALPATTADSDTASASLCRSATGADTDNAATDWHICTVPTPGSVNLVN